MPVKDSSLNPEDKAYRPAQTEVIIVRREMRIDYKKSYGGMSPYLRGIMGGRQGELLYTVCDNRDGHDEPRVLRYQVPRADCQECYGRTRWEKLPGAARFYIDTLSTAVELAGISFMDRLPVTVAWIKAALPDAGGTELDTLTAGMIGAADYKTLRRGDELRPVFREQAAASASDVMWVRKGTPLTWLPAGYTVSVNYEL